MRILTERFKKFKSWFYKNKEGIIVILIFSLYIIINISTEKFLK